MNCDGPSQLLVQEGRLSTRLPPLLQSKCPQRWRWRKAIRAPVVLMSVQRMEERLLGWVKGLRGSTSTSRPGRRLQGDRMYAAVWAWRDPELRAPSTGNNSACWVSIRTFEECLCNDFIGWTHLVKTIWKLILTCLKFYKSTP